MERLDRSKKGRSGETSQKQESIVVDLKKPSKEGWSCNDCDKRWRVLKGTTPSSPVKKSPILLTEKVWWASSRKM